MAREGYDKASQKAAEVADKAKDTLHRTMEQKHWQSDSGNSGADGRGDAPDSSANVAGAAGQQPPQRAGTAPGA